MAVTSHVCLIQTTSHFDIALWCVLRWGNVGHFEENQTKTKYLRSCASRFRSASGKYWVKHFLRPKRSCDRVEPTVGKLKTLKDIPRFPHRKTVPRSQLQSRISPPPSPHPTPFQTKFPDPVLQKSLLFVENLLSALNGSWNLIVSSHFLSYCFLFFCLLRLFVPFLTCLIPASVFPDV